MLRQLPRMLRLAAPRKEILNRGRYASNLSQSVNTPLLGGQVDELQAGVERSLVVFHSRLFFQPGKPVFHTAFLCFLLEFR